MTCVASTDAPSTDLAHVLDVDPLIIHVHRSAHRPFTCHARPDVGRAGHPVAVADSVRMGSLSPLAAMEFAADLAVGPRHAHVGTRRQVLVGTAARAGARGPRATCRLSTLVDRRLAHGPGLHHALAAARPARASDHRQSPADLFQFRLRSASVAMGRRCVAHGADDRRPVRGSRSCRRVG